MRNTSNTGAEYTPPPKLTLEVKWSVQQEPCVKLGFVHYVLSADDENLSPFTRIGVRTVDPGTVAKNFMLPTSAFADFKDKAITDVVNLLDSVLRSTGMLGPIRTNVSTMNPVLHAVMLEILSKYPCHELENGDWFFDFGSRVIGIAVDKFDPNKDECIDYVDLDSKHLPRTMRLMNAVNLQSIGWDTSMTMLDMLGAVVFPVFDNQRRIMTDRFNRFRRDLHDLETEATMTAASAWAEHDVVRASILLLHRITGQVRTRMIAKSATVTPGTVNFLEALRPEHGLLKLKKDALDSVASEISKELHGLLPATDATNDVDTTKDGV